MLGCMAKEKKKRKEPFCPCPQESFAAARMAILDLDILSHHCSRLRIGVYQKYPVVWSGFMHSPSRCLYGLSTVENNCQPSCCGQICKPSMVSNLAKLYVASLAAFGLRGMV